MENRNPGFLGITAIRTGNLVKRNILLVTAMSVVFVLAVSVHAGQRPRAVSTDKSLIIGILQVPPFSMKDQTGAWEGIGVDLWKEIAKDLNLQYQFREMDLDTLLAGMADGLIDLIVTPLVITPERVGMFDFSHAFYTSGLGVAVPKQSESDRWLSVVRAFLSIEFFEVLFTIGLLLVLAGYGVWLFERRRNPKQFGSNWWSGIGAGLWWSSVTFTGVGYGDKVPATLGGRIIALVWMFASLAIFTAFTASITARLAVSHFEQIRSQEDLQHYLVATIKGSDGEEYLRRNQIRMKIFPTLAAAMKALSQREVDAFVFSEASLKYMVNHENLDAIIEVLPEILEPQYLAFALPEGSPLREPVNRALLNITSQPLWDDIKYHYLGQ